MRGDVWGRARRRLQNLTVLDARTAYLWWQEDHLRRLLPHLGVDCVFDVGANGGQHAWMLRRKAGFTGRIISFEPIPEQADAIRRLSADDPLWTVEQVALSAADGTATFHVMNNDEFSSLSTPSHDETTRFTGDNRIVRSIEVRTETLASAFDRLQEQHDFERPFLKLDTQGFDVQIVKASPETTRKFRGLQSELAVRKLYADSVDFRDALATYESLGFTLSAFVPNNAGQFPILVETDCIMVRSDLAR